MKLKGYSEFLNENSLYIGDGFAGMAANQPLIQDGFLSSLLAVCAIKSLDKGFKPLNDYFANNSVMIKNVKDTGGDLFILTKAVADKKLLPEDVTSELTKFYALLKNKPDIAIDSNALLTLLSKINLTQFKSADSSLRDVFSNFQTKKITVEETLPFLKKFLKTAKMKEISSIFEAFEKSLSEDRLIALGLKVLPGSEKKSEEEVKKAAAAANQIYSVASGYEVYTNRLLIYLLLFETNSDAEIENLKKNYKLGKSVLSKYFLKNATDMKWLNNYSGGENKEGLKFVTPDNAGKNFQFPSPGELFTETNLGKLRKFLVEVADKEKVSTAFEYFGEIYKWSKMMSSTSLITMEMTKFTKRFNFDPNQSGGTIFDLSIDKKSSQFYDIDRGGSSARVKVLNPLSTRDQTIRANNDLVKKQLEYFQSLDAKDLAELLLFVGGRYVSIARLLMPYTRYSTTSPVKVTVLEYPELFKKMLKNDTTRGFLAAAYNDLFSYGYDTEKEDKLKILTPELYEVVIKFKDMLYEEEALGSSGFANGLTENDARRAWNLTKNNVPSFYQTISGYDSAQLDSLSYSFKEAIEEAEGIYNLLEKTETLEEYKELFLKQRYKTEALFELANSKVACPEGGKDPLFLMLFKSLDLNDERDSNLTENVYLRLDSSNTLRSVDSTKKILLEAKEKDPKVLEDYTDMFLATLAKWPPYTAGKIAYRILDSSSSGAQTIAELMGAEKFSELMPYVYGKLMTDADNSSTSYEVRAFLTSSLRIDEFNSAKGIMQEPENIVKYAVPLIQKMLNKDLSREYWKDDIFKAAFIVMSKTKTPLKTSYSNVPNTFGFNRMDRFIDAMELKVAFRYLYENKSENIAQFLSKEELETVYEKCSPALSKDNLGYMGKRSATEYMDSYPFLKSCEIPVEFVSSFLQEVDNIQANRYEESKKMALDYQKDKQLLPQPVYIKQLDDNFFSNAEFWRTILASSDKEIRSKVDDFLQMYETWIKLFNENSVTDPRQSARRLTIGKSYSCTSNLLKPELLDKLEKETIKKLCQTWMTYTLKGASVQTSDIDIDTFTEFSYRVSEEKILNTQEFNSMVASIDPTFKYALTRKFKEGAIIRPLLQKIVDQSEGGIVPMIDLSSTSGKASLLNALKFNNLDVSSAKLRRKPTESLIDYAERCKKFAESSEFSDLAKLKTTRIFATAEDLEIVSGSLYKYVSSGNVHGGTGLQVLEIYDVDMPSEELSAFKEENPSPTVIPAFHGTGSVAASMILRYGFKIVDKSLIKAGRMLGDGVYVSNIIDKSSQYVGDSGFTRSRGIEGYVFICNVYLGQENVNFKSAGCGSSRDGIKSAEWCLFDPKSQIEIIKTYKVKITNTDYMEQMYIKHRSKIELNKETESVEESIASKEVAFIKDRFKSFEQMFEAETEKETVDLKPTEETPFRGTFTFMDSYIPDEDGKVLTLEEFRKKYPGNQFMQIYPSQKGPVVTMLLKSQDSEGVHIIPNSKIFVSQNPENLFVLWKFALNQVSS